MELQHLFKVHVSHDQLEAEIWYNETEVDLPDEFILTEAEIMNYLKINNIIFGLIPENIQKLIGDYKNIQYPLLIAKGIEKTDGENGDIKYTYDTTTEVDRSKGWDFREVMRIPAVEKGDKLATIFPPTKGENGHSVHDKVIKAKPGKLFRMRAGKNVIFKEEDQSFYAEAEGQVSFGHHVIQIHNTYEISEDISMKTGNIDFLGTVIVKGDVPTGFSIKATGDVKIFGLVEGATVTSGGSVFVSEGMAGLKAGVIEADEDVHIGYVNQGKINAGNVIYVENSILHSECSATRSIICKEGNIIGGTLSAGYSITSKDVGNRMNTVTELSFGVNKHLFDSQQELMNEKETLQDNLRKLTLLKNKIGQEQNPSSKTKIMVLKLRQSFEKTDERLKEIDTELQAINSDLGSIDQSFLKVTGRVYPNTFVSFGKYRRSIDKNYDNVRIQMDNNEITIQQG